MKNENCSICGGWYGIHEYGTDKCPINGVENFKYQETTFKQKNHTFLRVPNEADPFAEIVDLKGRKMYLIINDDQDGEFYYRYKGETYYLPESYQVSFREIVEANK